MSVERGLSVPQAARALGKSESTVRRWVRNGAPTITLGRDGRGCGSRVDLAALRRWLYQQSQTDAGAAAARRETGPGAAHGVDLGGLLPQVSDLKEAIAQAIDDAYRRDCWLGLPAPRRWHIPDYKAAGFLVSVYERLTTNLFGAVPDPKPKRISDLEQIADEAIERNRAP